MFFLLRSNNVAGKKIPIAELRKTLEGNEYQNVETYIKSGNVALDAKSYP